MRIDWRLVHWLTATIGFGAVSALIFEYIWTVWLGNVIVAYTTQPLMFIERYVESPVFVALWIITVLSIYGHMRHPDRVGDKIGRR